MNAEALDALLNDIRRLRVAVLGDFCLDVYWHLDLSKSEPSLETGLETRPIRRQVVSLGGAGTTTHLAGAAAG